jgi:uncharacterized phage protein (TIGR02218 family)
MPDWIKQPLTALAFCWRLARRDGVVLGFTSHDQDLIVGGLLYRATPGMAPSSIERTSALDGDMVDLKGVLTSDAIRDDDLAAGRWDGARLALFAVNWEDPDSDTVPLVRGTLGTVTQDGASFTVALNGPTQMLDGPVHVVTSPDCRATLGDRQCRIDMAGQSQIVTVAAALGADVTVEEALPAGGFAFGRLRWIDGANAGLSSAIIIQDGPLLLLEEVAPFPVPTGTRAEIVQGCDRRFATCTARFANAVNFRGEPHLPGNDLLTRYAG